MFYEKKGILKYIGLGLGLGLGKFRSGNIIL